MDRTQPAQAPQARQKSATLGSEDKNLPPRRSLRPYRGFGTWVDLYDKPNWKNPEAEVLKMKRKGVETLFLETANYRIKEPIFKPNKTARFIDAAHEVGIDVVAWYLPDFKNLERDFRRSSAAINFETPNGEYFDSFALDIESTVVADVDKRNRRAFRLTRWIRKEVGDMALAGITPDPIGSLYWPDFPYKEIGEQYDVMMPMGYFTYRTSGPRKVAQHVGAGIKAIRQETNTKIHYIGGLSMFADRFETHTYVRTASKRNIMGGSFYDFIDTTAAQWDELRRLRKLRP